jgi:membrane protease YdiL (CAAX protease family)
MELLQLLVTQPLLVGLTGRPPDLETFRPLIGSPGLLLLGLALVWVLAAFGEETAYRGYLMNRVADLANQSRWAWFTSLIVVSTLFGLAHSGQGITGMIDEGIMGLLLGLMYLGCGRNLSVPIVAHGVQDTVDVLLIFLGRYPGL